MSYTSCSSVLFLWRILQRWVQWVRGFGGGEGKGSCKTLLLASGMHVRYCEYIKVAWWACGGKVPIEPGVTNIVEIVEAVIARLTDNEKCSIEVLKIAIEEQRRVYDELNTASQKVRVKILTLVGAGLALLTYLYSNPTSKINPLFIPPTLYGKIFYAFGSLLILGALSLLLFATKPGGQHELPTESEKLRNLSEKDEHKYLEYVKDRYLTCYKNNVFQYNIKYRLLNLSFLPLVFGAIILIVLKIFGT